VYLSSKSGDGGGHLRPNRAMRLLRVTLGKKRGERQDKGRPGGSHSSKKPGKRLSGVPLQKRSPKKLKKGKEGEGGDRFEAQKKRPCTHGCDAEKKDGKTLNGGSKKNILGQQRKYLVKIDSREPINETATMEKKDIYS